jgi:hypothetical protein
MKAGPNPLPALDAESAESKELRLLREQLDTMQKLLSKAEAREQMKTRPEAPDPPKAASPER